MPRRFSLLASLAAVILFMTGCTNDTTPAPPSAAGEHDHEHHHHHEDLGPNGGHLLALGSSGYQAEWLHDDENGVITVFVLDDKKQQAPVATAVTFETEVGGVVNNYELTAVNASADGSASEFTITNGELLTAVKIAEQSADAAEATLHVNTADAQWWAKIEVHDHSHGH